MTSSKRSFSVLYYGFVTVCVCVCVQLRARNKSLSKSCDNFSESFNRPATAALTQRRMPASVARISWQTPTGLSWATTLKILGEEGSMSTGDEKKGE